MRQTPSTPSRPDRRPGSVLLLALLTAVLVVTGSGAAQALATPRPTVRFAHVTPDRAPGYQGQVTCDPKERPGTVALRSLLRATYGKANSGGIVRSCSTGGRSEHKEGRAYDWMLDANRASDKAMADAFLAWLTGPDRNGYRGGNAQRLGVQYVIWNKRQWSTWDKRWIAYRGASPHTDHVHISLTWDGAMKRTSWWDGHEVLKFDHGPCVRTAGTLAPRYTKVNYTPCPKPRP
ncbi:hypothetical protein [Aquipuribacter sp. SD81]|uniref:hypothetical protein n=1 Tax=Aquipuribacter sp. SD81 TaxID=3127703 RepID=UPI00301702AD